MANNFPCYCSTGLLNQFPCGGVGCPWSEPPLVPVVKAEPAIPASCQAGRHQWWNYGLGDTQCTACPARPNW